MNNFIAKKINNKVNNYSNGNVIVESTLSGESRRPPSFKVQRHFSSSTNAGGGSSSSIQQKDGESITCGRLIEIPKLVDDDDVASESAAPEKKAESSYQKRSSRSNVSIRPELQKSQIRSKQKETNFEPSNGQRRINKTLAIRESKRSGDSLFKKNEKTRTKVFDSASTTDLRLNLDKIGTELSLIEESLSLRKVENYQREKRNQDNLKLEMATLKNRLKNIKTNTKVKSKNAQLSIFSLNKDLKPYNPNDFMDPGDSNNYSSKIDLSNTFVKINESLFISELGKNVAGIYNQSGGSLLNAFESDRTCDVAEKENIRRIRKELKKWKREYFSRTGKQFVDPLLENSCDDASSTDEPCASPVSSDLPNKTNAALRTEATVVKGTPDCAPEEKGLNTSVQETNSVKDLKEPEPPIDSCKRTVLAANEIDLTNCRLENYLLPPDSSRMTDCETGVCNIDSPTHEKNFVFIQKTEKLLHSAVQEISKLEQEIPKLKNEILNINYMCDDSDDNESLTRLQQEYSATTYQSNQQLMSATFPLCVDHSDDKKIFQISNEKTINKSSFNNDKIHNHKLNQICEECLTPRKTKLKVQTFNENKKNKQVTVKDGHKRGKWLPNKIRKHSCLLMPTDDCKKGTKPEKIQQLCHPCSKNEHQLKSSAKMSYENSIPMDVNNQTTIKENLKTSLEIGKNDQSDDVNKTNLQPDLKASKHSTSYNIVKVSSVSDSGARGFNSKHDMETNTEKGIPYRNLPNTSIININTQGTTTRTEMANESDLLSILSKNLVKQNLPCVNIKPALSKQIGPLIHIPAVSKFTMNKERNTNVIVKEYFHESCSSKHEDELQEGLDRLENRQINKKRSVFNENVKCSAKNYNETVICDELYHEDIDIDKIQERLRNVVRVYAEKLQSCGDNRVTCSHQQLIKTLKILNDNIAKLYDDQMNHYVKCGKNIPVKPPLSYRMKTVTDLLWEELDVRSHPTDEHCVQIDEILQYLVKDIKNVILKKAITDRSYPKNGFGPPQRNGEPSSRVGTSLRGPDEESERKKYQHPDCRFSKMFSHKLNPPTESGVPSTSINIDKSKINVVNKRKNSLTNSVGQKSIPVKRTTDKNFTQKRDHVHQVSALLDKNSKFISSPYWSNNNWLKLNKGKVDSSKNNSNKKIFHAQGDLHTEKAATERSTADNFVGKSTILPSDYLQKEKEQLEKLKRIKKIYKLNCDLHCLSEDNVDEFSNSIGKNRVKQSVHMSNEMEVIDDVEEVLQKVCISHKSEEDSKLTSIEKKEKNSSESTKERSNQEIIKEHNICDKSHEVILHETEQRTVEVEVHQEPVAHDNTYEDDWESEGNEIEGVDKSEENLSNDVKKSKVEKMSSSSSISSEILDIEDQSNTDDKKDTTGADEKTDNEISNSGIDNVNDNHLDSENISENVDDNIVIENNEDVTIDEKDHEVIGENNVAREFDDGKEIQYKHQDIINEKQSISDSLSVDKLECSNGIETIINTHDESGKIIHKSKSDDNVSIRSEDIESVIKDLSVSVLNELSKSEKLKEIESLKESIRSTSERLDALLPEYTDRGTNMSERVSNNKITENVGTQIEDEFHFKISSENVVDDNNKVLPLDFKKIHGTRLNYQTNLINSDTGTENSVCSGRNYEKDLERKSNYAEKQCIDNRQLTSVHFSFPDLEHNVPNSITMVSSTGTDNQEIKISFDVNKSPRNDGIVHENLTNKTPLNLDTESLSGMYLSCSKRNTDKVECNETITKKTKEIHIQTSCTPSPRIRIDHSKTDNYDHASKSKTNTGDIKNVIEKTVEEVLGRYDSYNKKSIEENVTTDRSNKNVNSKTEEVQTDFDLIKPTDKLDLNSITLISSEINRNTVETQTNDESVCTEKIPVSNENRADIERNYGAKELFNKPSTNYSDVLLKHNSNITSSSTTTTITASDCHLTSSFSSSSTSFQKSLAAARSTSTTSSSDDQLSEGEINLGSSSCSCSFGEIKMWGCKNCGPYGVRKTSNRKNTNINRYTWGQELLRFSDDTINVTKRKELFQNQIAGPSSSLPLNRQGCDQLSENINSKMASMDNKNSGNRSSVSSINQRIVIGCEKEKITSKTDSDDDVVIKSGPRNLMPNDSSKNPGKSELKLTLKSKKFSDVVKHVLDDLRMEKANKIGVNQNKYFSNIVSKNKISEVSDSCQQSNLRKERVKNNHRNKNVCDTPIVCIPSMNACVQNQIQSSYELQQTELLVLESNAQNHNFCYENLNKNKPCSSTNNVPIHEVTNSGDCKIDDVVKSNERLLKRKPENLNLVKTSSLSVKSSSSASSNPSGDFNHRIDQGDHLTTFDCIAEQLGQQCAGSSFELYHTKFSSIFTSRNDVKHEATPVYNDSSSSGEILTNLLLESSCTTQDSSDDNFPSAVALDFYLSNSSSDGECSEGQILFLGETKPLSKIGDTT